jgi:hypothetical protein
VFAEAWRPWIQDSPIFIWEHKLKETKRAIRDWVKIKATQGRTNIEYLTKKMENIRVKMEVDHVSPSLLIEY